MIFEHIKNYLSKENEDKLEDLLKQPYFPWYWYPTTAHTEWEPNQKSFFQHHVYLSDDSRSDLYPIIMDMFKFEEFETHKLNRIKANLYIKHYNRELIRPHMDLNGKGGITYIYYPETSDGPTRFYIDDEVIEVDPVKGDMIKFDTRILHTSDVPREYERRTCINFVFELP